MLLSMKKKINQEVLEKVEEIREEVPVQETLVKEGYRAMYGNKKQSNKDRDKRMENISNRRAEGLEAKKVIKDYKDKINRTEKILMSVLEEQNKKENKEELKSYAIHGRELATVMSAFHLSEEELAQKAGTGNSAIYKMRKGLPVWRTTAQHVANALGVSVESLMEQ